MKVARISAHVVNDHMDRMLIIAQTIGWGEIRDELADPRDPDKLMCFTSTGVMLVKSRCTGKLITAYVPELKKVYAIFVNNGYEHVPHYLYQKVQKNYALMKKMGLG